jgi:large subunit ribosomal protein L10
MNRTEKEAFVAAFRERIGRAPAVYLTDFTGLNVKEITQLRQNLRDVGAEYLVVKNRLARLALADEADFPDIDADLTGPTGVVFGFEGAVEPAKAVSEFAKAHQDKPVFKIGVLDAKIVDAAQIERLAKLPSREEILSQLAGALEGPMAALASALGAKIQEMSGLIDALKQQKEGA